MKESICIDTDICVDFLREREPGCASFSSAIQTYHCFLSTISAYELTLGARLMERFQDIEGFLLNLGLLPFTLDMARKAATIQADLRGNHKEIGLPDVFIAATCLTQNIPLLTRNKKHYSLVKGLKLI